MAKKAERNKIIAITGASTILAVALGFLVALKGHKRKRLHGFILQVNLSASEILKLADRIIAKSKLVHDSVASVPLDKVSYANVISPLAELEAEQFPLVQSCTFQKMVSASDDLRQASSEAERRIDVHLLMCSQREDVYRVIKALAAKGEWMSPEAKRYVQCMIKDFERNGVNLSLGKKEELERLRTIIDELSARYIENLNSDNTSLFFKESELVGVPLEFIKGLSKADDGRLKVTLKSHHTLPVLEYCKVWISRYFGATRRTVAIARGKKCGEENMQILEKLVQTRNKIARLLGYSNYAEYALETRMARTSTKVYEFLENISVNLTEMANKELTMLNSLKKKEEGESPFGLEDMLYYTRKAEEKEFEIDYGDVQQYFPVNLVISGIFKIFQDLFGLRFEEVQEAEVWHDDVRLLSVLDMSSNKHMGYFYLDLYSREGKYGRTCVLSLQNGCLSLNGTRQIPIALIIAQFPKQVGNKKALLRFSQVVNFFHEFSHVVHHICNRASFAKFSGLRVEADFIEVPGLLLEKWCYESICLKMISGYHQDITKPLVDEMCRALKRKRHSFFGLKVKQEILLCLFDQIIHSNENVDMTELLKHLHPKVLLGIPLLGEMNPASCFPRLVVGYDATCYSHLWSEVIASDIFSSKFEDDLLNQYEGLQFRNKILALGGAKDAKEILLGYLGREPSVQAYIDSRRKNSL
ncbi:probable thimet oligopeptidase isoform X1 [Amborella trichopoda]|uniref:probable thimet oligopeptidase isoform X1 n=1 Tax=Amborella trichopoda TaxID=13333 RepID=UPI0009BCD1FD|nr:probable thimet oligopeptidase isoform X1 [Amborella trichopoda]|eukprot:XP_020527746.1 probable thimet oligopeptidase isoform X1 [Amborella trichopoda]